MLVKGGFSVAANKACAIEKPRQSSGCRMWVNQRLYPNFHSWHGELDKHIPVARGRAVADGLSGCKTSYYPDEGHISLIVNHGEEIVKTLVERACTSVRLHERNQSSLRIRDLVT
jgi:hypothetical protein